MIKFPMPSTLDGAKLTEELIAAGVSTLAKDRSVPTGYAPPFIDGENNLFLDIDASEKDVAEAVVKAHKG